MGVLAYFCRGLQYMTTATQDDPEVIQLAKVLRGVVAPLRDIQRYGEGQVTVRCDNGWLMVAAKTPFYDTCERVE